MACDIASFAAACSFHRIARHWQQFAYRRWCIEQLDRSNPPGRKWDDTTFFKFKKAQSGDFYLAPFAFSPTGRAFDLVASHMVGGFGMRTFSVRPLFFVILRDFSFANYSPMLPPTAASDGATIPLGDIPLGRTRFNVASLNDVVRFRLARAKLVIHCLFVVYPVAFGESPLISTGALLRTVTPRSVRPLVQFVFGRIAHHFCVVRHVDRNNSLLR